MFNPSNTDPTGQTINDMLANTDAPAFDPNANNQGVMDALGDGTNTRSDSANMTDENGAPSNNNGATPRNGGLKLPGGSSGAAGQGAVVAAPQGTNSNIAPPSFLPPHPRQLNSPQQSMYDPLSGGMFPIYNPSPNTGQSRAYGSGNVSSPPNPAAGGVQANNLAALGLSPIVLIIGAAILAVMVLK